MEIKKVNWELPCDFEINDMATGVLFRLDGDVLETEVFLGGSGAFWGASIRGILKTFEKKDNAINYLVERIAGLAREETRKIAAFEFKYDGEGKWEYMCEGRIYGVDRMSGGKYLVLCGDRIYGVEEDKDKAVNLMLYRSVIDRVKGLVGIVGSGE